MRTPIIRFSLSGNTKKKSGGIFGGNPVSRKLPPLIVLVVLAAFVLSACGKSLDERGLPSDWPGDVPVYQPATVKSFSVREGGAGVVLETDSSPRKVASFYKGAFSKSGWKMGKGLPPLENQYYIYEGKKGPKSLSVNIFVKKNAGKAFTRAVVSMTKPRGAK